MTYLAPIPKDQITTHDREFSQDKSLMRVTEQDRISIREKAQGIAKSGLYKDVNTPEKALCIMLMGRALGVNEMTALQGIYIINGRPWISADLIFALIRAKGVCKNMEAETSLKGAMCSMTRKDDGFKFTARFGPEEAKLARLDTKDTYKMYPDQMYLHRAVRRCSTMVCPEILMGIGVDEDGFSTNEEMNGPQGELIAAELAEGEAQLEKDRRAYLAKTRMPSNEELIANNLELEAKRKARQSADVETVDYEPALFPEEVDNEQPNADLTVTCISGNVLSSAMDYYGILKDKKRNGPEFAEWLAKNFGTTAIEGVAEEDGQRLLKALKKAIDSPDRK